MDSAIWYWTVVVVVVVVVISRVSVGPDLVPLQEASGDAVQRSGCSSEVFRTAVSENGGSSGARVALRSA